MQQLGKVVCHVAVASAVVFLFFLISGSTLGKGLKTVLKGLGEAAVTSTSVVVNGSVHISLN